MDGGEGHPYRLFRSDFNCPGRCAPMPQEKSKQEQIDQIEKIEMCGDVVF